MMLETEGPSDGQQPEPRQRPQLQELHGWQQPPLRRQPFPVRLPAVRPGSQGGTAWRRWRRWSTGQPAQLPGVDDLRQQHEEQQPEEEAFLTPHHAASSVTDRTGRFNLCILLS